MKEAFLIRNEKWIWLFIFFIAFFIYFPTTNRPIRDAESKYVEIPREMLVTGDWITPQLDFVPYYTKPPLSFWITAIGYKIFGVHPWVARSVNIAWAFFLSFLIGIFASHIYGKGVGPIASACFLLTSEVFAYSLDAGIEFALISCITLSLLFFWIFLEKGQKRYMRYFYFCMGVGYLIKGLLGIFIPLAVVIFFLIFTKRFLEIKKLGDPVGISILLILVLPWTIIMSIKHPDFFKYYILNEHIGRLIGKRDTSEALYPTSLFLAHVIGEFFPWIMYLPILLIGIYRRHSEKSTIYLLLWIIVPLSLFSLSKNKVDFYGMHIYPPLIILLSPNIRNFILKKNGLLKLWSYPWLFLSIIAIFSFLFLSIKGNSALIRSLDIPSMPWAKMFLFVSFISGLIIWFFISRKKIISSILAFSLYICFFFLCTLKMYLADFYKDSMKFAADVYQKMSINAPIFCANLPEFSHIGTINFYTKRPAYVLKMPGDKLPSYKERRKMYVDKEKFLNIIEKKGLVFVIGKINNIKGYLHKIGVQFHILSTSDDRAIFLVSNDLKSFFY